MKTAKDFLFHVHEEDESIVATITSKEFWEKHRRVDDTEANAGVITGYGLDIVMEGTYEPQQEMTAAQLRAKLLADGFVEDASFTAFLNRCQ